MSETIETVSPASGLNGSINHPIDIPCDGPAPRFADPADAVRLTGRRVAVRCASKDEAADVAFALGCPGVVEALAIVGHIQATDEPTRRLAEYLLATQD